MGRWIWLPSTLSAEVMAHQEFDFLALDTQHGGMDFDSGFRVMQVIPATDMPVLVRVGWNDPRLIMKYLDAGAFGIIVPMVNTADEAARAVAACRYPPAGMRSAGPFRAASYADSNYMSHSRMAGSQLQSPPQCANIAMCSSVASLHRANRSI